MTNGDFYTFAFNSNASDIKVYISIRNKIYKKTNGEDVEINEDQYDRPEDILVIKKEGKVIGGTRISCVDAGSSAKLPLEELGFDISKIIPGIKNYRHCESARSCLIPEESNNGQVFAKAMAIIVAEAVARKCNYLFFVTAAQLADHFTQLGTKLGCELVKTNQKLALTFNTKSIELCLFYTSLQDKIRHAIKKEELAAC